ncbi:MAG: triose-phosphate isomerase [Janthinobacterium lividum]
MRQKIVAGNWKMNLEYNEGLSIFSEVINMVNDEVTGQQIAIICSPYTYLHSLAQLAKGHGKVFVGAQNCHQAEAGAFTGEISAKMIRSVGAQYVILGHSERRQYFNETNDLLAQKADVVLSNSLKPIFCVGETLDERESEQHFEVIKTQLKEGIFHLSTEQFSQTIIAYEPVWAIGTGKTATAEQAQEIHAFIRNEIADNYNQEVADNTSILYGGSCNTKNANELFSQPDIDGGLIGGASLKSRDFVDIIKAF